MKKCAFITLGCKVNQYETQAIREVVLEKGYAETTPDSKADLYVINTCTVTAVSDSKSKQYIRKVHRTNPDAIIIVTGCYAEAYKKELTRINGKKTIVVGNDKKTDIARILQGNGLTDCDTGKSSIFDLNISSFSGHTRAFLKIEDGCGNRCSYCIVPYVRGSVKSRPINDIKREAKRLAANGYTEIVLTGIHLGAYGIEVGRRQGTEAGREKVEDRSRGRWHGQTPEPVRGRLRGLPMHNYKSGNRKISIIDVLKELEDISGIKRIRISSIEAYEITDELVSMIANSEKICPHLHLPLQSGDDYILKRMNRRYTVDKYLSLLDTVRKKIEYPSFTTDIIVGFPGEETRHFENTISTCRNAGFSRMHIFPFSVRHGTSAAKMDNYNDPDTIMERKNIISSVANELANKYKQNFVKKNLEVLVESRLDKNTGMLCGYTERYVKVVFEGNEEKMDNIVTVYAKEIKDNNIYGVLV